MSSGDVNVTGAKGTVPLKFCPTRSILAVGLVTWPKLFDAGVKLGGTLNNPLSGPVVVPGVAWGVDVAPSICGPGSFPNGYTGLPKESVPLGAGNAIL